MQSLTVFRSTKELLEVCKQIKTEETVARPGGLKLPTFWFVAT
jgi:hypothetical protein